MQHGAEHLAVERRPDLGVSRVADAESAADVQNLDRVANSEPGGQVAAIAAQRLAVAKGADDNIALLYGCHASTGQLELVIAAFIV